MSVRVGRTEYLRLIVDGRKEVFVAQPYTLEDPLYCWRVKEDRSTGRKFFVNVGGLGKKWSLPDIQSSAFRDEVRQLDGAHSHRRRDSSTPSRLDSERSAPRHHTYGPPSASHSTPYLHKNGASSSSPSSFERMTYSSPSVVVVRPPPPPTAASSSALLPAQPASSVAVTLGTDGSTTAFVYDDDDWRALDEARKRTEMLRAQEQHMQQTMQEERELMDRVRRGQLAPIIAHAPLSLDETDAALQEHESLIAIELAKRRAEQKERTQTMQSELEAIRREEQQLQSMIDRDRQQVRALHEAHVAALRKEREELEQAALQKQQKQQSASSSTPPQPANAATAFTPPSTHKWADPYSLLAEKSAASRSPSSSAPHVGDTTTGGPTVAHLLSVIDTLQKLLEHERRQNEKLQRQLDQQERLTLEQVAADAEREKQDIALRLQMLEAIAAQRRVSLEQEQQSQRAGRQEEDREGTRLRNQLLKQYASNNHEEEEGGRLDEGYHPQRFDAVGRHGDGSSNSRRSVPKHPLDDDDDD